MKHLKLYKQFRLILEDNKEKLSPEKFTIQPYPIDESDNDKNKPTLLLIPGGGGNPISDYSALAPLLKETFNLITFSYDENVKDNGKEKCKEIAKQLKSYPNLSILGFSMGTTFGFWIIKELGSDFKGKFICIDAAAPNAIAPDKYVRFESDDKIKFAIQALLVDRAFVNTLKKLIVQVQKDEIPGDEQVPEQPEAITPEGNIN